MSTPKELQTLEHDFVPGVEAGYEYRCKKCRLREHNPIHSGVATSSKPSEWDMEHLWPKPKDE